MNFFQLSKNKSFIIAEVGVNHNGDENLAIKMTESAIESGADCVKFQTFKAENLILKDAPKAKYQLLNTPKSESQFQMLKKLELKKNTYLKLKKICEQKNVLFLSTPYSFEDVDFLSKIKVKAFKLASIHTFEPHFIKYVAKKNKPIFFSSGMASYKDVQLAIKTFKYYSKKKEFALMQCNSNYPSKIEDSNLNVLLEYKKISKIVGYSDHTANNLSAIVALSLGARVFEKHFTIDKRLCGPDQSSSYNVNEFKKYIKDLRDTEKILGNKIKKITKSEKLNFFAMRRTLVAKTDIKKGTQINEKDIALKRPLLGLKPNEIKKIIGKKTKYNLLKDTVFRINDFN
jgi:N,N'-diacetyllegionaminate synthase